MKRKFEITDPIPMLINRKYVIEIDTEDYPDVNFDEQGEIDEIITDLISEYYGPMDESDRDVIESENYHSAEWKEI